MKKQCSIWAIAFCLLPLEAQPLHLTCDYSSNPLAVNGAEPQLGWRLAEGMQQAYELEAFDAQGTAVWQTGRVESTQSQHIVWRGTSLLPGREYTWRVRVWTGDEFPSDWSAVARFVTAPANEWLDAQWIGAITRADSRLPEGRGYEGNTVNRNQEMKAAWANTDTLSRQSLLLRKEFRVGRKLTRALVYVSGLGHYELSVNGQKVGQSEFAPLWSDYDKTVYANVYDVTDLLSRRNALGVLLGNGFYNVQGGRYRKLLVSFGPPTLFLKLHLDYADGTSEDIRSDASWKYSLSPIVFNDIYGGEDYDARREQPGWNLPGFDEGNWRPVVLQEAPLGQLCLQTAPPVTIGEEYAPRAQWQRLQPADRKQRIEQDVNVTVLDMGQNLAGFPAIRVRGRRGATLRLTVGESLSADSLVNQSQSGRPHYYEYTLKGDARRPDAAGETEQWHPRFSYYGFRYIQIQGAVLEGQPNPDGLPIVEDIRSCFVFNSAPIVGRFESSNEIFNGVHRLIQMAVRSNMQAVFTDCPHREKLGWLEQMQLNGEGLLYNYDFTTFWPKIVQDMADAQLEDGMVPTTAPNYTRFGGFWQNSPEWGSSAVILPFMYYQRYGDDRLIRRFYPMMQAYVDFLENTSDHHITTVGLGDWYDFGKERCGFAQNTPVPLVGTAHHYQNIRYAERAASMLGLPADSARYAALADEVNRAFHERYFREDSCLYGTGSQCSYALPLYLNMVAPEHRDSAMAHLLADIRAHGMRLSTGEVGNRYMFELLADEGYDDVMYAMHNHQEVPGYGFQLKYGATTLTEQWDPRQGASWNHFMLGAIDEWFFRSLGGIRMDTERPGGQHLVIRPSVVGDLNAVDCATETLYGTVSVSWQKTADGSFRMTVSLPGNSSATVCLPDGSEPVEMTAGEQTFETRLGL